MALYMCICSVWRIHVCQSRRDPVSCDFLPQQCLTMLHYHVNKFNPFVNVVFCTVTKDISAHYNCVPLLRPSMVLETVPQSFSCQTQTVYYASQHEVSLLMICIKVSLLFTLRVVHGIFNGNACRHFIQLQVWWCSCTLRISSDMSAGDGPHD